MDKLDKYMNMRPYDNHEVVDNIKDLSKRMAFTAVMDYIFPDITEEEIKEKVSAIRSTEDFQSNISRLALKKILSQTSSTYKANGLKELDENSSYLFISNHRDIVLDSAILSYSLLKNGFVSNESAIGDNLVFSETFEHIAKMNKNFIVKRGGSPREILKNSQLLSSYIEHVINHKNTSVWLAQMEGRAKDGNDRTQASLLKMVALNSNGDLVNYLKSLRIVPMTISYEYDPTDTMKIPSIIAKAKDLIYEKEDREDMANIIAGLKGYKGKIVLNVGKALDKELEVLNGIKQKSEIFQTLAKIIDEKIHKQYHLHKTNYIAYDLLHKTTKFNTFYNEDQISIFDKNIWLKAKMFGKEDVFVYDLLLKMYANPVVNKLNYND